MSYFKNENGEVFFYDDEQLSQGFGANLKKMTKNEIDIHLSPIESQAQINQKARARLASTDWYVIRKQETGVDIPPEILDERAKLRLMVSE